MSNVVPLKPGAAPAPGTAQGAVGTAQGAVRHILIVEDDANDAELLQACLAEALRDGSIILHARTLAEGLALERAHEVQLTLLDLDLPDSTGFRTLERMRASATGPVVVISGNGHPALVDEALKRRAYDVIPKHELDAATLRRVLRLATLHHEAGRALRATEGRLRALVENSAEALVLFDAAGRIEYASASLRRVLGYEAAEVVGRNGLAFVHAEDRASVQEAFPKLVAAAGSSTTLRVRFTHKDGSTRVLESTLVNRLGDGEVAGIVCSFRDLTQEEQQRARFDATFENAAVGLAHVDLEGCFLIANRRLAEMLGYAPAELVGRSVRALSHPEDIDVTAGQRAQLRAGLIPQFTRRKRYLRKDGAVLWVQLTVSLERDVQGAPLYEIAAFEDVSEVVRAEEKLRASESRLRAIIGAEPECVKVLDEAGTLLDMNPAGLAMIEADSLEAVAGQCVYPLVAPDYRAAFRELVERACRGERGMLEFEVIGLRGTRRWMETHVVPLRDEDRGRKLMLGIARDITSRKKAEVSARRLGRMYAALSATNEAILKAEDAPTLYRRVCELLVEHGGLKLAAVRLVDPDTGWIETVAHAGEPASYLERARVSVDPGRPEAHGPAGRAVLEGRSVVNNDYLGDPMLALWHDVARESGIGSTMSVPLRRGGAVVGLITLYAAETAWFDPELVGLAERMVQNVTFALDNLDRDGAVRESEARFRSLTELSSDYYWETDTEHRLSVRSSGDAVVAQSTFGPGGGIGKRRWELPFRSPDMEGWMAHRAVLDAHEPFHGFEFSRPTAAGGERFFSITGGPRFDAAGNFAGYRGVGTDITERSLAQRALALEHAVVRHLGVAHTAEAGLQAVMRSICELNGWNCGRYWQADEAAGVLRFGGSWSEPGAESEAMRAQTLAATFAPGSGLAGRVWQTGEPIWVADAARDERVLRRGLVLLAGMRGVFLFPVTVEARTIGVLVFAGRELRELDERLLRSVAVIGSQIGQFLSRMHAEQATRESEARFRGLTELSSDFYWETDAGHRFTLRGSGGKVSAVHMFRTDRILGKTRWELPFLTPDMDGWRAHKAVLDAHLPFRDFEFSRLGQDGGERHIVTSGEPVFDAEGRFTGYRGVGTDITERKLAERRLQLEHQVARHLAEAADAPTGVAGAIRTICETERWDCGRYYEVDEKAGALRYSNSWSVDDAEVRRFIDATAAFTHKPGEGVRGAVWQTGAPVWVADVREDPRVPEQVRACTGEMRGAFVVPVSAESKVIGVLSFASRVVREPDQRLLKAMGVIGSQLGQFLARVRAEQATRESEARFRSLTELSADWYWEQDAQFRFTVLSGPGAAALANGQVESYLGKTRWDTPDLEPLEGGWEAHRAMLERHEPFHDLVLRRKLRDGGDGYMSVSGEPVRDAYGRFTGYRGVAKTVTGKVRAEHQMRMHAERQGAIAGFGQFALGRHGVEELYTEAARALRCEGVDAVCLLEMFSERREYLVRAAHGEGPHASIGLSGPMAPDSVWPEILRENAPRIAGREYLATRPLDRPWRAWLHKMGSAVYAPVRDDEKPIAMLCMYAVQEHAFGPEDVRFAESVGHVLSTALQRQKAEERLARMAQFDALTGLPNRTLLQDRLGQSIVQSRRRQLHAGVLFVDLDRFKLINDTLGHHLGDVLIRQVGQRLLACVRPGDTVGRISGDEFAVVLADMARPDDAALVGQKILESLAVPFDLGGNEAYVTASVGIAVYPGDGDDAETLLKNADMAMYRAKESSRNSYCFFTAEMNQRSVAKVQLNADLRHALERAEFTLHYQPKVDLKTGQLRGLEALLRWNHPLRGLVSPAEFIPALEDSGLIVPVGEWVVEEACRQLRGWAGKGLAPVPVAVNLSPKQFRRRDLDVLIRDTLARAGIASEYLELEITESGLMDNAEDAVRVMRNLRAAGLKISIDDFGTGYSSLSYLTRLPLSALKIDGSFVREAGSSAESASIVRAIIDMAQNLRLTVIAEGVETEEQAAFLRARGCDQAQGYLYSRPLPAAGIDAWLAAA